MGTRSRAATTVGVLIIVATAHARRPGWHRPTVARGRGDG